MRVVPLVRIVFLFCLMFPVCINQEAYAIRNIDEFFHNKIKDGKPPKRITNEELRWQPAARSQAIATIFNNGWIVRQRDKPFDKDIAAGRYSKVIEEVQEEIESLSPFWKKDSAAQISRYLQVLATAYELNGNWKEALDTWALLYGTTSDEYYWALIRILYGSGDKEFAYVLACDMVASLHWVNVDDVKQKIKEKGPVVYSSFLNGGGVWDQEWLALLRFRNECARVICPEMYFVSSNGVEKREDKGTLGFRVLQSQSYSKFVDFMQEQWKSRQGEGRADSKEEKMIQFIEAVNTVPNPYIRQGMGY